MVEAPSTEANSNQRQLSPQEFGVVFEALPLGFSMKKRGKGVPGAKVHNVAEQDGPHRALRTMDLVMSVGSTLVHSMPYVACLLPVWFGISADALLMMCDGCVQVPKRQAGHPVRDSVTEGW